MLIFVLRALRAVRAETMQEGRIVSPPPTCAPTLPCCGRTRGGDTIVLESSFNVHTGLSYK